MSQSIRNIPNLEVMDLDTDSQDISNTGDKLCSEALSDLVLSFDQRMSLEDSGKISGYARSSSYKSITSSQKRHSSELNLSGCQVTVFDMRDSNLTSGKPIFLNVHEQLVLHKISEIYHVPESYLISMQSGVSGEQNTRVVAILRDSECLTLFMRWDSGFLSDCQCITVNCNASAKSLTMHLDKIFDKNFHGKYSLFCNHKKLNYDQCMTEQGVVSGYEILFREIRSVTLKCLYRSSPITDIIYYVNSFSTDAIDEVKSKVLKTMKQLEPPNEEIRNLSSPEQIWLTSGNRLYSNREYIGSPALSDINNISSGLSEFVDVVIHVSQPSNCIPVNVLCTGSNNSQNIHKIVISTSMSTAQLRYQISTIMHCPPNALKITINQKRIPEIDHVNNCREMQENCIIMASVRQAIVINVAYDKQTFSISVMKLDPVFVVKQKLSDTTGHQTKYMKLIFEDKEPNDHNLIEKIHLKDGSDMQAMLLPNRIRVSIRKHGKEPLHLIIDDSKKLKMKHLKAFYKNKIKLKPKFDIDYHSYGQLEQFEDSTSLDSQGIGDGCRLYATESVNYYQIGVLKKIFEYKEDGQIHIVNGAIIKGKLYKGMDDAGVSDDSSLEFDSLDKSHEIPGIRLACPEEIANNSDNTNKMTDPNLSNATLNPLRLDLSTAVALSSQQLGNYSSGMMSTDSPTSSTLRDNIFFITQRNTTPNLSIPHSITIPSLGEPPGVVSDKVLDDLVKELPANVWQPFMRELLLDAEITKHIDSHRGNVHEQMFQCLKSWKQRDGSKATKRVLQDALRSQNLNYTSIKVFGEEVQSV